MPTVNGKKYPYTAAGKAAAKKAAGKTSVSYLGNVVKEVKQTAKNASNAVDKYLNGNRPLPKGMKIGPSNVKKEAGQLAGAVFQGRRYDEKGKQIKATAKKAAVVAKKINLDAKANAMSKRGGTPMPKAKKTAIGVKPRGGRPLKKSM